MIHINSKKYLQDTYKLNQRVKTLTELSEKALNMACSTVSVNGGDRVQTTHGNSTEGKILDYCEIKRELELAIQELEKRKDEIRSVAYQLNAISGAIIIGRYLLFKSWACIAIDTNLTENNIRHTYHQNAINEFDKIYNSH